MSAVVAQRSPPRPVADQGPAPGAFDANSPTPWGQSGSPRLTEAVLAAADDVKSSAEKLPVSHRLPVSRSVFDSDEGDVCNGPHLPLPTCKSLYSLQRLASHNQAALHGIDTAVPSCIPSTCFWNTIWFVMVCLLVTLLGCLGL